MRTLAAPIVPDFRTVVLDHDRGVLMEAYHPTSREFMGSIRFLNEGLVAKVVDLSVAHQWRQRGVHDKLIEHLRWRGFKVIEQYSDVGEEWAKTASRSTAYRGFPIVFTDRALVLRLLEALAAGNTRVAIEAAMAQMTSGARDAWWSAGGYDGGRGTGRWWTTDRSSAWLYASPSGDFGFPTYLTATYDDADWAHAESMDGQGIAWYHLDPGTPLSVVEAKMDVPSPEMARLLIEEMAVHGTDLDRLADWHMWTIGNDAYVEVDLPIGSLPKTAGFRDATDVPSTLYHGTWRDLAPGTELRAGVVPSNWGERPGLAAKVVWMTEDIDDARSWAIQGAKEMGQPIDQVFVYEVRPVGPLLEWDPPDYLARMGIRHFTAESAVVASITRRGSTPSLYHGTNIALAPGDTILPARQSGRSNFDESYTYYDPNYVYLSEQVHLAERYARGAARKGGGEPHVYLVQPSGSAWKDPEGVETGFGTDQWVTRLATVVEEVPLTKTAERIYPLIVRPGTYYRVHPRGRPFSQADAQSVVFDREKLAPSVQRILQPVAGYSCFANPFNLMQYAREMGWDDAEDEWGRPTVSDPVIRFEGRQVGEGVDGEPVVMPTSGILETISWSDFIDRIEVSPGAIPGVEGAKVAISDDDPAWADLAEALSGPSKRPYEPILPPAHELYGGFIQEGSDGRLWLDGEPVRKLYRVVDPKEWEAAQANGYLQSTGPTAGGGYTRASAKPDDRWRNQLGGGTAVLEIDYDPADGWHASAEGYAATRSRIPLSRVRKVGMSSPARVASIAEARERLPEAFLREPHEVLYPPIWDGLRMRPEARTAILNHAYAAFGALPYEGKLHFAVIGSGASYNWDEAGDLDVQVWCSDPALVGPLRRAIIPVNNPTTGELGLGGEMAVQYYVKPGEGSPEENLAGQPYACFDIDTETWLKKPVPLTPEFYAEAIASILGRARGVASEVEGLLAAYDRAEREVAYWSLFPEHQARQGEAEAVVREIHADIVALFRSIFDARKDAYAPGGRGIEDERDAMVKALEVWGLWERLKKLGQAKVGDLLKTAVSESDRQAFYEWQMALRAGGGPIPLEAAQNFLRRILTNEGFPRGDEAYVQRGSQPNVAMIGWDWEVSPPIPFIHAGPGTPDIITVIHEAAHIIVNRGREPIGGWEGAHDDEWLDTYLRLLDKWAGAGKANVMRRGRDQGWRAAS